METLDWNTIIKKYFVDLVELVKSGIDFGAKEVPLYLKELITYEFYHSAIWAVIYALFAMASFWFLRKCYLKFKSLDKYESSEDEYIFSTLGGIVGLILTISFVVCSIDEIDYAVKTKVAPRVIIVEKIQQLIKETTTNTGTK